ncbi:MAG: hypothetical protein R3B68_07875 [Phycisphaerales bacterium]
MGLLTDFFVAKPEAITPEVVDAGPHGTFPTAQLKNVDVVKIATLEGIACEGQVGDAAARIPEATAEAEHGEAWVFPIAARLASRLAGADEGELKRIGEAWAKTEEFRLDGWGPRDVVEALTAIAALARNAQANGGGLFLWMCL